MPLPLTYTLHMQKKPGILQEIQSVLQETPFSLQEISCVLKEIPSMLQEIRCLYIARNTLCS